MNRSKPKAGDVLLTDSIKAHTGHLFCDDPKAKLIAVFLGTVHEGMDPDVPGRLKKLGWDRSVVYEGTVQYGDGENRWAHRLNYQADSPKEAGLAAVRFARRMLQEERDAVEDRKESVNVLALTVRTMRLGVIDDEGRPHNGRGPAFITWGADSGDTLDDLVQKIEEAQ